MKILDTELPDVKVITPKIFSDDRGFFFESYNKRDLQSLLGIEEDFVQDNHSKSVKHVLRGLHYQVKNPQGKLVRVVVGKVYDVAVDIRMDSPTFGKWVGIYLSADEHNMMWIPPGFAHGFLALTDVVEFLYKTTAYYDPSSERTLLWNDPTLSIQWPLDGGPILSEKDKIGQRLLLS